VRGDAIPRNPSVTRFIKPGKQAGAEFRNETVTYKCQKKTPLNWIFFLAKFMGLCRSLGVLV